MRFGVAVRRCVPPVLSLSLVLLLTLVAGAVAAGRSPARAAAVSNTISITNPGKQSGAVGSGVQMWVRATDSDSAQELHFDATGLPPGLGIVLRTGRITGMPGTAGTFTSVVTASDSTGATASVAFTWTIAAGGGLRISPEGLGGGLKGVMLSEQVHATDSTPGQTLTYAAANLPAGLVIDPSTGVISGTPGAPGISYAIVSASDTAGAVTWWPVTWVVGPSAPLVTSPGNLNDNVGTPVWVHIHATDTDPAEVLGFTAQGLPPGLVINYLTGEVHGVPTAAGTYAVTVTAIDQAAVTGAAQAAAPGSASFTWTVSAARRTTVTLHRPADQVSMVGDGVSYQIQADDSADGQILTYGAAKLPPGLTLDPGTGQITGQVTMPGSWKVSIAATDTTGASATTTFSWTVQVSTGVNNVTVVNPGEQSSPPGTPLSLQIHASDSVPGSRSPTAPATCRLACPSTRPPA